MAEVNRRATQRDTIERMHTFVLSDEFDEITLVAARERRKLLERSMKQYTEENMTIVENLPRTADLGLHNRHAAETETLYLEAMENLQMKITELERNEPNEVRAIHEVRPINGAAAEMRLERIKPSIFDGSYSNWNEWRAMYESLVHNVAGVTNTQRFHYLKKSISGAAERVVSGWQTTGENYQQAYQSLVEVYDNPYRIIMAHLDELTNMERNKLETHDGLRLLIDTTNRVLRQLRVVGCPVDKWDNFVVHALISRMAPRTLQEWETSQDLRQMPSVDDVVKFLERRARGIVNLKQSQTQTQNESSEQQYKERYTGTKPKVKLVQNANQQNQSRANPNALGGGTCYNCQQIHPMYRCKQFLSLTVNQRRDRTRELQLCFNCFMPTHRAGSQSCKFGACKSCPGKLHNSLLCKAEQMKVGSYMTVNPTPMNLQSDVASQQMMAQQMQASQNMNPQAQQNMNPQAQSWQPNQAVQSAAVNRLTSLNFQ